jgi:hypothetical protein
MPFIFKTLEVRSQAGLIEHCFHPVIFDESDCDLKNVEIKRGQSRVVQPVNPTLGTECCCSVCAPVKASSGRAMVAGSCAPPDRGFPSPFVGLPEEGPCAVGSTKARCWFLARQLMAS